MEPVTVKLLLAQRMVRSLELLMVLELVVLKAMW
jgi:hypothetical protein